MPWHVGKSASCPASKPWAVIKDADGSVVGCHESKAEADAQLAALNINATSRPPDRDVASGPMGEHNDESVQVPWSQESSVSAEDFRFAVAPITHVDVRDVSDSHGYWTMSGYAAVFSTKTTLYDGRFLKLTEEISPHFFDRVLREQSLDQSDGVVHFNLGHDMNRSVAATDVPAGQPGSLQLRVDSQGLGFLAKVPHEDPDGLAMAVKMRSGVLRQASFAFTIGREESTFREAEDTVDGKDSEHVVLMECKHLYDVCATPQGAYATTVSGLRSLATALGQLDDRWAVGQYGSRDSARQPSGDEEPVSLEEGDGADPDNQPDVSDAAREKLARTLELRETARTRFKSRKVRNG